MELQSWKPAWNLPWLRSGLHCLPGVFLRIFLQSKTKRKNLLCFFFHFLSYEYDLDQEFLKRVEVDGKVVEYSYAQDGALERVLYNDGSYEEFHWQRTGELNISNPCMRESTKTPPGPMGRKTQEIINFFLLVHICKKGRMAESSSRSNSLGNCEVCSEHD